MKKLYLVLALLFIQANAFTKETPKDHKLVMAYLYSDDLLNILQSIPSPIEISALIKETGATYDRTHLSDPKFSKNYTMSHKKALNLGVYGTDLGYVNLYESNQDVINYLDAVKELAGGLNVGQYFDYELLKKMVASRNNLGELLRITQKNFEKMNTELQGRKQEDVSVLILAGGWLEAMHITTMIYEKTKNQKLREKIGEQKITLQQLLLALAELKDKPNMGALYQDFDQLRLVYEKVNLITTDGKPVISEDSNGEIVINRDNMSKVELTDSTLTSIGSLVKGIRAKVIK